MAAIGRLPSDKLAEGNGVVFRRALVVPGVPEQARWNRPSFLNGGAVSLADLPEGVVDFVDAALHDSSGKPESGLSRDRPGNPNPFQTLVPDDGRV